MLTEWRNAMGPRFLPPRGRLGPCGLLPRSRRPQPGPAPYPEPGAELPGAAQGVHGAEAGGGEQRGGEDGERGPASPGTNPASGPRPAPRPGHASPASQRRPGSSALTSRPGVPAGHAGNGAHNRAQAEEGREEKAG